MDLRNVFMVQKSKPRWMILLNLVDSVNFPSDIWWHAVKRLRNIFNHCFKASFDARRPLYFDSFWFHVINRCSPTLKVKVSSVAVVTRTYSKISQVFLCYRNLDFFAFFCSK